MNANTAPNPPAALTLSKDADGNTVLRWEAPAVEDADTGDSIASYRIYRDGTGLADRYGSVQGTERMAVDSNTGCVPHRYWITAVDTRLAESTLLGPVDG